MEADDVVIEYLRKKLGMARGSRAGKILKPPMQEEEGESLEMSPEDSAELEGLMGGEESEETCEKCGAESGACSC